MSLTSKTRYTWLNDTRTGGSGTGHSYNVFEGGREGGRKRGARYREKERETKCRQKERKGVPSSDLNLLKRHVSHRGLAKAGSSLRFGTFSLRLSSLLSSASAPASALSHLDRRIVTNGSEISPLIIFVC